LRTHLLSSCRELISKLSKCKHIVIVHHWDSDGISSAALLSRIFNDRELSFLVPKIGLYSANAIDLGNLAPSKNTIIILLDYGLPPDEVIRLRRMVDSEVAVIDHHVNEALGRLFCNPIALGCPEDDYPSTTWVLKEILDVSGHEDLVALGVIGDVGRFIRSYEISSWVNDVCSKYGLTINDLIKASGIIDTCYRLIDYKCIDYAREVLTSKSVREVLRSRRLLGKYLRLREEIAKALNNAEVTDVDRVIKLFRVNSDSYITSCIGRELARKFKDKVIVLCHEVRKLGMSYIYVRSHKYILRHVLQGLKSKGLKVGGKDRVLVITCRNNRCDELDTLLRTLKLYLE